MEDKYIVHQEIYRDNSDQEYVEALITLINNKRKRWLHDEFRELIVKSSFHGVNKGRLEVYMRLFEECTSFDSEGLSLVHFEELEFASLNALYEFLYKRHFTKEKKKEKKFKHIRSTDRKDFFGEKGIFKSFLAAGFIKEVKDPNPTKYSYRTKIIVPRPTLNWPLRYKLRNEAQTTIDGQEGFYTGKEEYWGLDEFHNALYMYTERDDEYYFDYFKTPYSHLPKNPDIDLVSYLDGLLKRVDELSLDFMTRLTFHYFENKYPALQKPQTISTKKQTNNNQLEVNKND